MPLDFKKFCFPSPSGDHAFSNKEGDFLFDYKALGFRPLQGIMHLASCKPGETVKLKGVTFPSPSGDHAFSNDDIWLLYVILGILWFPSPSGDHAFSNQSIEEYFINEYSREFPSPSGDHAFSNWKRFIDTFWDKFPSPSGDHAFSNLWLILFPILSAIVSVTFRGSCI